MEKDDIKENEAITEAKESEASNSEINETTADANEVKELVTDSGKAQEVVNNSSGKIILANILDQVLIIAVSALLLVIVDFILKLFGYMFVRENGGMLLGGGIIYFIINCVYVPIFEKSKLKSTIGKKILNMN